MSQILSVIKNYDTTTYNKILEDKLTTIRDEFGADAVTELQNKINTLVDRYDDGQTGGAIQFVISMMYIGMKYESALKKRDIELVNEAKSIMREKNSKIDSLVAFIKTQEEEINRLSKQLSQNKISNQNEKYEKQKRTFLVNNVVAKTDKAKAKRHDFIEEAQDTQAFKDFFKDRKGNQTVPTSVLREAKKELGSNNIRFKKGETIDVMKKP